MTERLLEYLPQNAKSILELGCGTGNLTLRLATKFRAATITTVDAATEMIEITRRRLEMLQSSRGGPNNFVTAKFEELDFSPGSFELVTSCISLHHVRDKGALYAAIFRWLRPGGTFRFADQMAGGTEVNHQINWSRWLEFCREPGHCSEAEIQSLIDHAAAHDHYTPVPEHLKLLEAAGFQHDKLDCAWRNWMWGIVTADR